MGRPSEYKPEFAKQAEKLALLGATDIQIADFFEVSERTLNTWKMKHTDFLQSLKVGKDEADRNVEQSLYRRALGYEHDAVKIFCSKEGQVTTVPYRQVVPPDTTACIFWLKNRKKKEWRDKIDHEVGGRDGAPIRSEHRIVFVSPKGEVTRVVESSQGQRESGSDSGA